ADCGPECVGGLARIAYTRGARLLFGTAIRLAPRPKPEPPQTLGNGKMQLWPLRRSPASAPRTPQAAPDRPQELLVVCHSDDTHGLAIMENICTGLEFAKVGFSVLDIKRSAVWPRMDAFAAIVVCTELLWDLGAEKAVELEDHVRSGGGLFVAYRCWNPHLSRLLGGGQVDREPEMELTSRLSFDREILPGASGLKIGDSDWLLEHSRFDLDADVLSPDCSIFASDGEGRPVGWSRAHGRGRVVYWNTGILFCRALRGFAVQTILHTMEVGVSAAAGFAMFHIDDFPASLSQARPEPVSTEYPELDWNGFFFGVWHRDMMALRAKYALKYTWYAIMNYHDVDTGADADPSAPTVMSGGSVLESRFRHIAETADDDEYGFHGYNHEPLIGEAWPDLATLGSKLGLARTLWESAVPAAMPTSWVPANNWYHAEHLQVLKEAFPEITTLCSTFSTGSVEFGEYREFGPEPWDEELLCLPRETYGYLLNPELRMMMLSQLSGMGVWTHFVHPDDIYDLPASPGETIARRNPDGHMWRATNAAGQRGLYHHLDDWLSEATALYPWLEFVTTSQARERYLAHVSNDVEILRRAGAIEIRSGSASVFYVRTSPGVELVPEAEGRILDRRDLDDAILHVVRCTAGTTVFRLAEAGGRLPGL
ncbi:MAG: DUF2194 domain-containing protein, partial [Flavobacteriaceae bacterium]